MTKRDRPEIGHIVRYFPTMDERAAAGLGPCLPAIVVGVGPTDGPSSHVVHLQVFTDSSTGVVYREFVKYGFSTGEWSWPTGGRS